MNLLELKKSISNNQLENLYIFSGDEVAVQDIYVSKLTKCFTGVICYLDTIAGIIPRLKGNSLLSNKPTLYVIRNDKDFLLNEKFWGLFEDKQLLRHNVLLFIYSSIDKRGKFYKHFENTIVFFDKLSEDILIKYIQKECPLSVSNAKELIQICESSYNRILLELDKLKRLSDCKSVDINKAYDIGKQHNLTYVPPMGAVFDLLDAILTRDVSNTYKLYYESQRRGDSSLAIISLLGNNVKAILQVQTIEGNSNLTDITGLTGFQIKLAKEKLRYYSDMELVRMLKVLQYCEKAIKTGLMEADMVIDYLLVNIL